MTRKLVWVSAMMATSAGAWAPLNLGRIDITLTPDARKYCHIVRFPHGWAFPRFAQSGAPLIFDHTTEFEFRVEGVQSTQFLVGVFKELVAGHRYEAANLYMLNLSDPNGPVFPANRKGWESAAVVPIARKSVWSPGESLPRETRASLRGLQFAKTGDFWVEPSGNATRLSPDVAWIVLQSTTGAFGDSPTKVFLDVFNADTGKKIVTIAGVYTCSRGAYDVDGYLAMTGWITERYFIVPLGEHKERCLVCEFGSAR